MRALYRFLLQLYPNAFRAQFGEEMLSVFDEAAAYERCRGSATYARFCVRETAGLLCNLFLRGNLMRHKRLILYGAGAGLVIGLAIGAVWASRPYTSTAVLRTVPPMIPERYVVSANDSLAIELPAIRQSIMSRSTLTNVIATFNLYPSERKRMPMEDVVEIMREAVRFSPNERPLQISFTYHDRELAQKITADLVGLFMSEYLRALQSRSVMTLAFLKDRVSAAARGWELSLANIRAAQAEGKPLDRPKLDADIARKRYEEFSAKLAEAETFESLAMRQQSGGLEVLDPASLPSDTRPAIWFTTLVGTLSGAVIGWLVAWMLSLRPRAVVADVAG
jgi:hypothetical protein